MKYVVGIDLGTSYFKTIIVNEKGTVAGLSRVRTPKQINGAFVTICPQTFLQTIRKSIFLAAKQQNIALNDIDAISYSSMSNTFALLDKYNQPLTDFYVWITQFTQEVDSELSELWINPQYIEDTGLGGWLSPDITLAKLLWIQKSRKDLWTKTHKVILLPSYLAMFMTRQFHTDVSTSSLLGLVNVKTNTWHDDSLSVLKMQPDQFGKPVKSGALIGSLTKEAANIFGLQPGVKVFSGGLDHIIAAVGAGLGHLSPLSESTGTVIASLGYSEDYKPRKGVALSHFPYTNGYANLAFYGMGSVAIEYYHNKYFPELTIDEMLQQATKQPIGSNGVQYFDWENPLMPIEDRFHKRTGNRFDEVRAVMEGICYRTYLMRKAVSLEKKSNCIVSTGGLNRSKDLLRLKSDLLGTNVITSGQKEPAAFGAAILAALGLGWFPSLAEIQKSWVTQSEKYVPVLENTKAYTKWIRERQEYFQ